MFLVALRFQFLVFFFFFPIVNLTPKSDCTAMTNSSVEYSVNNLLLQKDNATEPLCRADSEIAEDAF